MNNIFSKRFFVWTSVLLILINFLWGMQYFSLKKDFNVVRSKNDQTDINNNVLVFTQMFVDKVLRASQEVNFETRLQLENAVRNIKDDDILNKWKLFLEAKGETEAQNRVKELLFTLVNKIKQN